MQLVVPCEFVHVLPQALQCVTLPSVVSQPLPICESQLPKPALQVPSVQTPLGHVSLALARLHGAPHAPQSVSVSMLVSQPSSGLPLQLRQKPLHVGEQSYVPGIPVHPVVPCRFVQALPHAAQFDVVPSAVSQPAAAVQSAKPALQLVGTHMPFVHAAPEFGNEQTFPHDPQFIVVVTLVSQPSSGFMLQLSQPASQTGEQSNEPGVPVQPFEP